MDVEGAVAWARRAAAGERSVVCGRNRRLDVDLESLGTVILLLWCVRSQLNPDMPFSEKQKKKPQISTKKHIGIDPVRCQAAVPEWINDPSEECKANYRNDNDTLQRMGTVVRLPPILEPPKARKAVNDMCKCYHPGSEAYVEVNVKEAWKRVKYQLGEQAFKNCGFGAMGERVLKLWTAEDKKKLADFEKLIPQSKSTIEDFMEVALKQFSSERTTDLAKYCYNVFLPRRFASLNRAGSTNSIDAISDDEGNSQDDNKVHLSEENGKSSGSSLKRSRE